MAVCGPCLIGSFFFYLPLKTTFDNHVLCCIFFKWRRCFNADVEADMFKPATLAEKHSRKTKGSLFFNNNNKTNRVKNPLCSDWRSSLTAPGPQTGLNQFKTQRQSELGHLRSALSGI